MTGYTATLVDDEDTERGVEQPQKQPRQWRWLGLSLVTLVVVGAVCCSVWRPRRVTLTQRVAMISKVSKTILSGMKARKLEDDPDDPLFHGTLSFELKEEDDEEDLDGFSVTAVVEKSDATSDGLKVIFGAKEGKGEDVKQFLDFVCNSMKGEGGEERRRLSEEEPCNVEVGEDDADEVSIFISLPEVEQGMQHEYEEFEGTEEGPEEGDASLSHEIEPKFTSSVVLGRTFGEMLEAVENNKCVSVLPAGVKASLELQLAKGIALAAEQTMGPMKSVEDLFAFSDMNFDMALKYNKEQFENAPDAQPAQPMYDMMLHGIVQSLPPGFEHPEGVESIASLKKIEIDQEGVDGKWALDVTFQHFDFDKILTDLAALLEEE